MSHESFVGKQFVRVYRGLNGVTPDKVRTEGVGPHWTTDRETAENFATLREETGSPGTVLSGMVDKEHVIGVGSAEHSQWQRRQKVLDPEIEHEVTVRPGSPVLVDGHEYIDPYASPEKAAVYKKAKRYTA